MAEREGFEQAGRRAKRVNMRDARETREPDANRKQKKRSRSKRKIFPGASRKVCAQVRGAETRRIFPGISRRLRRRSRRGASGAGRRRRRRGMGGMRFRASFARGDVCGRRASRERFRRCRRGTGGMGRSGAVRVLTSAGRRRRRGVRRHHSQRNR